jgi:sugar/nucleoside kinase (ribokinase family)
MTAAASGGAFHPSSAGSAPRVDLVIAGNLLVDDIVLAGGRTWMGEAGGAALHAALGASLWPAAIGVASVGGTDYPAAALRALAARGVALDGVRPSGKPALRTWLLYEPEVRQVVHQLGRPSHAEVSPRHADLPAAFRGARAFHLAPMPIDVQREWVEALASSGATISLDPYTPIDAATLPAWQDLLAGVDLLFVSEDDLRLPGTDARPEPVLERLAGGRLRRIFFKRGRRGGVIHDRDAGARAWAALGGDAIDATGAGDAFAGGYLAALVRDADPEEALRQALVSASFAIEDWGARGAQAAAPARAAARLREWFPAASATRGAR